MSRPRLSLTAKTVVEKLRLPSDMADDFAARCAELGYSRSEKLRDLVASFLMQTAALARVKAKAKKGGAA